MYQYPPVVYVCRPALKVCVLERGGARMPSLGTEFTKICMHALLYTRLIVLINLPVYGPIEILTTVLLVYRSRKKNVLGKLHYL